MQTDSQITLVEMKVVVGLGTAMLISNAAIARKVVAIPVAKLLVIFDSLVSFSLLLLF